MAHREVERVDIDKLEGRVTGVLLTPYPPGIPLLIPASASTAPSCSTCSSRASSTSASRFETYIHGLADEVGEDGEKRYYVDCLKEE